MTYRRGEQFGEDAALHVCFQVYATNGLVRTACIASLVMSSLSDPTILNSHV